MLKISKKNNYLEKLYGKLKTENFIHDVKNNTNNVKQ